MFQCHFFKDVWTFLFSFPEMLNAILLFFKRAKPSLLGATRDFGTARFIFSLFSCPRLITIIVNNVPTELFNFDAQLLWAHWSDHFPFLRSEIGKVAVDHVRSFRQPQIFRRQKTSEHY